MVHRMTLPPEPVLLPNQYNERNIEQISPQRAPSQPRYGEGRTRPSRRQNYISLNTRAIQSVMKNTFVFGKGVHDPVIGQPYGKSLTWNERGNIRKPQVEAYGSTFELSSETDYETGLAVLMGV